VRLEELVLASDAGLAEETPHFDDLMLGYHVLDLAGVLHRTFQAKPQRSLRLRK
jgi:hypothetical protein